MAPLARPIFVKKIPLARLISTSMVPWMAFSRQSLPNFCILWTKNLKKFGFLHRNYRSLTFLWPKLPKSIPCPDQNRLKLPKSIPCPDQNRLKLPKSIPLPRLSGLKLAKRIPLARLESLKKYTCCILCLFFDGDKFQIWTRGPGSCLGLRA